MSSITEQFSAATKSQLEAQLNFFNSYASKAVESAQKVLALNISTTKASVEKSSAAARRLLEAKDPQEFFSVGKPPGFDHLLAYSRELFGIASAAQAELIQSAKEQIKQAAPAAASFVTTPVAKVTLAEVPKPAAAPAAVIGTASANEPDAAPAATPKAVKAAAKAKPATVATPIADAIVQLVEPAEVAKPAAAPAVAAAPAAAPAAVPVAVPAVAAAPKAAVLKSTPKPVAAPKAAAKPTAVSFPTAKSVALKSVAAPAKTAPGKPQAKQLDMLGGGKGKK